jgi:hypothetical protein
MRPKHYHEATEEERRKSGRKIRLPSEDGHDSQVDKRTFWLPTWRRVIHGILIGIAVLASMFIGGPAGMIVLLMLLFVWVVAKSIWEAHHTRLPEVEKKHIHLNIKR